MITRSSSSSRSVSIVAGLVRSLLSFFFTDKIADVKVVSVTAQCCRQGTIIAPISKINELLKLPSSHLIEEMLY